MLFNQRVRVTESGNSFTGKDGVVRTRYSWSKHEIKVLIDGEDKPVLMRPSYLTEINKDGTLKKFEAGDIVTVIDPTDKKFGEEGVFIGYFNYYCTNIVCIELRSHYSDYRLRPHQIKKVNVFQDWFGESL